ncbi:hypothetical protein TrLO_g1415 [Triparma laevis f. longispina]|uniref:Uncharacterized protein n=1 Tax=Triparma laevis f. longispina TaxID=1714387 RepID=A0A9W7FQ45_9STRA|nr:hypothetical protein TrLO_g1415 [Triparma laevis f. longispina]
MHELKQASPTGSFLTLRPSDQSGSRDVITQRRKSSIFKSALTTTFSDDQSFDQKPSRKKIKDTERLHFNEMD